MFSASAVLGGFNTGFSRRRGSVTPASLRLGSSSTSVSPSDSGRKSGLLSMVMRVMSGLGRREFGGEEFGGGKSLFPSSGHVIIRISADVMNPLALFAAPLTCIAGWW